MWSLLSQRHLLSLIKPATYKDKLINHTNLNRKTKQKEKNYKINYFNIKIVKSTKIILKKIIKKIEKEKREKGKKLYIKKKNV